MILEPIQQMNSVNEIYEYILFNSTSLESTNKNIKMNDRFNFKDLYIYLCNTYVSRGSAISSLDFLIASNTKEFKKIYTKEDDTENTIQLARVVIYFFLLDYYNGIYDNEIYRNFGFRINGNVEQFKKLFLKENVDKFCSHLLLKAKQEERRGLANRVVSYKKEENGGYKAEISYIDVAFTSYESSFEDEHSKDIDCLMYEKGEIKNTPNECEMYRNDNIYSYMWRNIDVLTDKQKEFINHILSLDLGSYEFLFKNDCDKYSKELKCSYRKNIKNRFEQKLLIENKHIKYNGNYYKLVKTDSSFLLEKIKKQKTQKGKFEVITKLLKKDNEIGRLLNDLVIDNGYMGIFTSFYRDGYSKEIYRFINGRGLKTILERVDELCS